ncbi:MAG TPA: aminotransferase [Rhodobacteraceae bacterium]|nr:aminotransferase class V-fold PLP-dependent enzyme [Paracoccaceae bacterium]HBG97822.1 aminotransferase [Paracoccaceae bacterium]
MPGTRIYLDWNATAPLRPEARAAMLDAMDAVGNPSSVHAEGRAAKAIVERARGQVAELVGCDPGEVVFTSGATEAAALAVAQKRRHGGRFLALGSEHDCLAVWSDEELPALHDTEGVAFRGMQAILDAVLQPVGRVWAPDRGDTALVALSSANSETGLMLPGGSVATDNRVHAFLGGTVPFAVVTDLVQHAGKVPVTFANADRPSYAILSAHKMGGPKGIGALINYKSHDLEPIQRGGGQEMGRRSGTENVIGIAGFGAAAEEAQRDLAAGVWDRVAELRNILENLLAESVKETIFVGKDAARLPNTSCFAVPGWKGETQVMQMDLAGYAISAGSACSSGKVRESRVLRAMAFPAEVASSAIRVSLGPTTTEDDIRGFARAWIDHHRRRASRRA